MVYFGMVTETLLNAAIKDHGYLASWGVYEACEMPGQGWIQVIPAVSQSRHCWPPWESAGQRPAGLLVLYFACIISAMAVTP